MGAEIGKQLASDRATPGQREMALDLTSEEVVLHEGNAAAGWRRFAGVALDDPEFLEVIGLLRAEAERELGDVPVRLWLPAEQVLKLSLRTDAEESRARRAAAFRHASRETGHAAENLAVALGPAGPGGAATLLVTYAETWREARDYAARWGFAPGPVSTRHHAEDFAPSGPEFVLAADDGHEGPEDERDSDARAHAWVAVAMAALIWTALPATLVASQAPAAAPLPEVRGMEAAGAVVESAAGAATDVAVILPPARPAAGETRETAPGGPAPLPQDMEPAGPSAAAVVAAEPGGFAAPLPAERPEGTAPSGAMAGTAVASAGASFLPPRRPPFGMRLDRAALIGVLNLESGREALLRLPGGGFRRCEVGDVLDGWEVTAIGADAMQIRRGAESRTLLLVSR